MDQLPALKQVAGEGHFYIDPPEDVTMSYPCILLEMDNGDTKFADDNPYVFTQGYTLTVIDADTPGELVPQVRQLQACVQTRHFVTDNLHHTVFKIYF